jgi:DNA-binding NarL/FixJ family response regulator
MMRPNDHYRLLLIGRDLADAAVVHQALADSQDGPFTLEFLSHLADGLDRLSRGGVAIVLLDLALPDCPGLMSFRQVQRAAPDVPIVVLSAADDERTARQAVELGAQDYLLKGHVDGHAFPRALRSIVDRKATEEALFNEKERAEVTLNSIGDAVISTDLSGRVT